MQQKMKYLKDRYKEAKDHNRHKTEVERKTSPFYDEIDSVLGCRDIVTFSCIEESGPGSSSSSSSNSNGKEGGPEDEGRKDEGSAGYAIIKGQVVIQNNDLLDVIIIARFYFFLI